MTRRTPLTNEEKETIINFNKAEPMANIFTYEESWQKHLEGLGLKPVHDNGFGGKEYLIDKKRIRPPRAPVKFSAETKQKMAERMRGIPRQKSPNSAPKSSAVVAKQAKGVRGVSEH